MLLLFLISSVILCVILYVLEVYIHKSESNVNLIKIVGFLILSICLSFYINYLINPKIKYIVPKKNDSNNGDNGDNAGIIPTLTSNFNALEDKLDKNLKSISGSKKTNDNFFKSNFKIF